MSSNNGDCIYGWVKASFLPWTVWPSVILISGGKRTVLWTRPANVTKREDPLLSLFPVKDYEISSLSSFLKVNFIDYKAKHTFSWSSFSDVTTRTVFTKVYAKHSIIIIEMNRSRAINNWSSLYAIWGSLCRYTFVLIGFPDLCLIIPCETACWTARNISGE